MTRFTDIDRQYGLPQGTLDSVWTQESGRGTNRGNSSAGARGHFQFMPRTREEFMRNNPGLDPWSDNPEEAARCAAIYLSADLRRFDGDLDKALAAYNAGGGRVSSAVRRAGDNWLQTLPRETRNYVPQILARIGTSVDEIDSEQAYTAARQARIDSGRAPTEAELAEEERHAARRRQLLEAGGTDTSEISNDSILGQLFFTLLVGFISKAVEQQQASPAAPAAPAPQTPAPSPSATDPVAAAIANARPTTPVTLDADAPAPSGAAPRTPVVASAPQRASAHA